MPGEGGQGSPRLLLGSGSVFCALPALGAAFPGVFSLHPPVHGLSRLPRAHETCESVTFSLSAGFRLPGLFIYYFFIIFFLPLACSAVPGRSSSSRSLPRVFFQPWQCRALSQTVQTPSGLLRWGAPENPGDVLERAQGRGFCLPSPRLSRACRGTRDVVDFHSPRGRSRIWGGSE